VACSRGSSYNNISAQYRTGVRERHRHRHDRGQRRRLPGDPRAADEPDARHIPVGGQLDAGTVHRLSAPPAVQDTDAGVADHDDVQAQHGRPQTERPVDVGLVRNIRVAGHQRVRHDRLEPQVGQVEL